MRDRLQDVQQWPAAFGKSLFSEVLVGKETVGLGEVLQHTPLAKADPLPKDVIMPPLIAVVFVIENIADVVTIGISAVTVFPESLTFEHEDSNAIVSNPTDKTLVITC